MTVGTIGTFYISGRARRGSSLVEMLISIVVLALVLLSMIGMFVISKTAVYSKEDEMANSLGLRLMEQVEAMPFDDFKAGAVPFNLTIPSSDSDLEQGKYRATATVRNVTDYSADIRVRVSWSSAIGGKTLEMGRVISAVGNRNVGDAKP